MFEAVLPRQAGDTLPSSPAGILASVADKLDSLVGLTAAVGVPSATAGECHAAGAALRQSRAAARAT